MDKCQWCCKDTSGYGMVVLTIKEDERPNSICEDCYNKYMAELLKIKDFKDFEKDLKFIDCDGIEHYFKIMKKNLPMCISWEAVEILEEDKIGYLFQILQEFEENPKDALKRLHKKIEEGLSRKFIERRVSFGQEFNSIKNDIAEGRIEWDERYEGNIPKFIIDGEEYSFYELGKMMMSYEGWNFKLEIIEPSD